MKILIIGCGYVGSAAARHWKEKNFSITVTTRSKDRIDELQKISDQVFFAEKYTPEFFASILDSHQAVLLCTAPNTHSPLGYQEAYLDVAKALSEALKENHIVKKVFYTSSSRVYGDHSGATVDELTPPKADNPYSEILIKTEQTLLEAATATRNICVFRLSGIYGPERLISGRLKKLKGNAMQEDGEEIINLIHLNDIVNALEFALVHDMKGVFNLCNDLHLSRKELYDRICSRENIPLIQLTPPQVKKDRKVVSNVKIKSMGFAFKENGQLGSDL